MKPLLTSLLCLAPIVAPLAAATAARADISCQFVQVCLPEEPCKETDQAASITGAKSAPMIAMPDQTPYPAEAIDKDGYLLLLGKASEQDWDVMTISPEGAAQWTIGSPPDMAFAFVYSGTCSGELQ